MNKAHQLGTNPVYVVERNEQKIKKYIDQQRKGC